MTLTGSRHQRGNLFVVLILGDTLCGCWPITQMIVLILSTIELTLQLMFAGFGYPSTVFSIKRIRDGPDTEQWEVWLSISGHTPGWELPGAGWTEGGGTVVIETSERGSQDWRLIVSWEPARPGVHWGPARPGVHGKEDTPTTLPLLNPNVYQMTCSSQLLIQ